VADLSLQVSAVLFLTHGHLLESLQLVGKLISFICQLLKIVALAFHLLGQVVDMSLQCQDLLDKVLFLLLGLLEGLLLTSEVTLKILHLLVKVSILLA